MDHWGVTKKDRHKKERKSTLRGLVVAYKIRRGADRGRGRGSGGRHEPVEHNKRGNIHTHKKPWADLHVVRNSTQTREHGPKRKTNGSLITSPSMAKAPGVPYPKLQVNSFLYLYIITLPLSIQHIYMLIYHGYV